MLITKDNLSILIERECKKNISNGRLLRYWSALMEERYNIPTQKSSDILTMRTNLRDESDFICYAVYDTMEKKPKTLDKIFTESEIKEYSKSVYKVNKIKFPLKFKMIEVDPGQQYIGMIDVQQLIGLREAQIIRYNEETQRTLTKRVEGETEFYSITLDRNAVNSIEDFMERGIYIPTALTFNLPEDAKFYYDENSKELVINETDYLDITDGYHRYIAIANAYNKDPNFTQNMELRITSFSAGKANQFIWQEDQKTKMRKVDSDSYNQTDFVNKIAQQINSDSNFLLAGSISRNKGIINLSDFAAVSNMCFYAGKVIAKKREVEYMLETKKKLIDGLNKIISQDPEMSSKEWDLYYLTAAIYLIASDENINADDVRKLREILAKEENDYIFKNGFSKNSMTRINKLWKDGD